MNTALQVVDTLGAWGCSGEGGSASPMAAMEGDMPERGLITAIVPCSYLVLQSGYAHVNNVA